MEVWATPNDRLKSKLPMLIILCSFILKRNGIEENKWEFKSPGLKSVSSVNYCEVRSILKGKGVQLSNNSSTCSFLEKSQVYARLPRAAQIPCGS